MREPTYLVLLRWSTDQVSTATASSPRCATFPMAGPHWAPGTLYGALDRLVAEGQIEPDHDERVDGRLRRYHRLDRGRPSGDPG